MKGSIRYFDEVVRDNAVMKIEQIAKSIAKGFDCESTISFNNMYPPAINHDKQAEIVKNLAKECFGSDNVNTTYGVPMFASDDISYFLKERPGAYIYLNNIKTGGQPLSLHTPYMDFNDNIISTGVYLNIKISEDRLGISLL